MKILCCRQILFLDVLHLMTSLMRCYSSTPRRSSAISFALYLLAIYYLHISVRLPLPSPRSSFTLCQSHSTSTSISFFTSPYIPLIFALILLSYIIFEHSKILNLFVSIFCLSVCLSLCLICLSVCLFVCLRVMSGCLFVCLRVSSGCLSVRLLSGYSTRRQWHCCCR